MQPAYGVYQNAVSSSNRQKNTLGYVPQSSKQTGLYQKAPNREDQTASGSAANRSGLSPMSDNQKNEEPLNLEMPLQRNNDKVETAPNKPLNSVGPNTGSSKDSQIDEH